MTSEGCLFCKIALREVPSDIVYDDDGVIAFRDIHPQAPVHLLIVPRRHVTSLAEVTVKDEPWLGHLLQVARKLAEDENLTKSGFRTVINTGTHAGQTVQHLHVHLLGGRSLSWPPG